MMEPGQKAPVFSMPDQDGKIHHLSDYAGQWVILYFYPRDMTPGCTIEACNFRDDFPAFNELDAVILGVSKDSVTRHAKFAGKYNLPFTLLSDEDGSVCEAYGAWQEKSLYGKKYMGINRSTFVIDPEGIVARIYPKVKVKGHAAELLQALKEMK